ncbi:hypothetical protein PMI16_00554 [Herbaspirillum sp. CF444]|uniref:hypothetical protein n=1 Tax=Herbaspirillum sp. CF444 TaxID=1144319 RepID=UPI0002727E17|nr:hypothetical protein [Herbaspirillum sp. CF444]EJL93504.1 hypothetical protein PMI16_00554 [Herbaspirillum sp. CF444]
MDPNEIGQAVSFLNAVKEVTAIAARFKALLETAPKAEANGTANRFESFQLTNGTFATDFLLQTEFGKIAAAFGLVNHDKEIYGAYQFSLAVLPDATAPEEIKWVKLSTLFFDKFGNTARPAPCDSIALGEDDPSTFKRHFFGSLILAASEALPVA